MEKVLTGKREQQQREQGLVSICAQIGETINEFSSDVTMSGNSNLAVPTEKATKGYVDGALDDIADAIGSGNYDSSLTTWEDYDSDRGDSGGRRPLAYTVGPVQILDINYDSYSDEVLSYRETISLGYGFTETKDVAITYNSDGSIDTITTTVV